MNEPTPRGRTIYIVSDDGESPPTVLGSLHGQHDDDGEFDKRIAIIVDAFRLNGQIKVAEARDAIPF
jgi:hypothetical protein